MNLNRREELFEEAADCDQAAKDCMAQNLYHDAACMEHRAREIRKVLDLELCRVMWAEKQQLTLDEIMSK
jgi:hypothetical protein